MVFDEGEWECSWEKERLCLNEVLFLGLCNGGLPLEEYLVQALVGFGVGSFVDKVKEVSNPLSG